MFWRCFDDIIIVYVDFLWEALNSSAQWMIQDEWYQIQGFAEIQIQAMVTTFIDLEHPFCLLGFKDLTLPGESQLEAVRGRATLGGLWVS